MTALTSYEDDPGNAGLARALERAGSSPDRQEVYDNLLTGEVLVPTIEREEDETGPAVAVLTTSEGSSVMVGFTSSQALLRWSSEAERFTVLSGVQLARLARQNHIDGVVLDEGSEGQLVLAPAELDQLADGRAPVPAEDPAGARSYASRRIRPTAAEWPAETLSQLREVGRYALVDSVYLFDISYEGGEPLPAVGVRFNTTDPGAVDAVMRDVAGRLRATLPRNTKVDLVTVDDELLNALAGQVRPLGV